MKKNVLVLALSIVSFGAFAQGLGDLKNAAKEAESAKEKVTAAIDTEKKAAEEKTAKINAEKTDELKNKAAEVVNVETTTVDAAANAVEGFAGDAAKKIATDKVDAIKEVAEAKLADIKAKRAEKLEAIKGDPKKVEEHNATLKTETAEKEALKSEKKAALLTKITTLGSKIAAAESKLELLKKSRASEEEVSTKTKILDGAKAKLASLTASYM